MTNVRFSDTKSSMLLNLLSVGEAQMFLLDVRGVLDKNPVKMSCQLIKYKYVSALLHWYVPY